MTHQLKRFLREESGPTAVEYAIMLAMIVMFCIASIRSFGNSTAESFGDSANQLAAIFGS